MICGLSPLLKGRAREVVNLRACCENGVVLVDGHFLMPKIVHTDDDAVALVSKDDEVPLFEHCAAEPRPFVGGDWTTIVVFDGAT